MKNIVSNKMIQSIISSHTDVLFYTVYLIDQINMNSIPLKQMSRELTK